MVATAARDQARQIEDLIAGRLDSAIDPAPLFRISLARGGREELAALLRLIDDPRKLARVRAGRESLEGLTEDAAALTVARAAFLGLPEAKRGALFAAPAGSAAGPRAPPDADERLNRANTGRQALENFLAGEPTRAAALQLDLLDPEGPALSPTRRKAILASYAKANEVSAAEEAKAAAELTEAQAERDRLLGRILGLPADEFRGLVEQTGASSGGDPNAQASAAERARQRAEAEAEAAQSQVARLVAEERAKLLAVKARQALFSGRLQAGQAEIRDVVERAVEQRGKVQDLLDEAAYAEAHDVKADTLYAEVVQSLQAFRADLRDTLNADRGLPADLDPPALDPMLSSGPMRNEALAVLRDELLAENARLSERAAAQRRSKQAALYQAIVSLNDARLDLVGEISPDLRRRVLGFGAEGLAQVRRELDQIGLSLAYNGHELPATLAKAAEPFRRPSPSVILDLALLVALLFALRSWRRNGAALLSRLEEAYRNRPHRSLATAATALGANFIRRLGRPLDWLVFVLVAQWLQPDWLQFPGQQIAWIIATWVAATAFVIRAVDVLAHAEKADDPRAALRRRSLLLVAGFVLAAGLALSLARATVGQGAIYSWILRASWLPLVPMAFLLAEWWKERIDALADIGARRSAILRWAARRPPGLLGAIARVLAGGALLVEGLRANLAERARGIALVREIFDQRARKAAAERAASDRASGRYLPLSADQASVLDPHRAPLTPQRVTASAQTLALPELAAGHVHAMFGERGLGKSTVLAAWSDALAPRRVIQLQVGAEGLDGVLADLAASLGAAAQDEAVLGALQALGDPPAIFIDDLQRLIIPAIGGLADFDRLIDLTRRAGGSASWVFTCAAAGWSYLSRARSGRISFDTCAPIPFWSREDLRALIERRTAQAGLQPDFAQFENNGRMHFTSDLTPEERDRRAFFEALFEYCQGNPAVALEFWRRSLFQDQVTGRTVVRTFSTPDAEGLASLPGDTLYVLRTLLQVDVAGAEVIQRCTDLPKVVVLDALRALSQKGVVVTEGSGCKISLFWARDVVRLLERRNLLVRTAR